MNIAMISVTLNAVLPMMKALEPYLSRFSVKNYLDEGLQALVAKEGGVTANSLSRMKKIIAKAAEDGAEAIVLTCTVFSPHYEELQTDIRIPLICADTVMLEMAAEQKKKTAILCTFPASVESSGAIFKAASKKIGAAWNEADVFLLSDAAEAIRQRHFEAHNRIIADIADNLASLYQVVVLAQISMAEAAVLIKKTDTIILTSPSTVVGKLLELAKVPLE